MLTNRWYFAAAACALLLPAAACGGSDEEEAVVPEGTHYGYVVSKVLVPTNTTTAKDYGLDLGSSKSGTPDGSVDNSLGNLLGFLGGTGFNVQMTVDKAISEGTILLLVDFQTKDFTTSSAAGLSVKLGGTSNPPACDANNVCGQHLKGDAMFTISPNSPTDALVAGKIVGGTFTGGPGEVSLQFALGTSPPITLNLVNARAKATGLSATGMTANIAGALLVSEINSQIIPAVHTAINGVLETDCGPLATRDKANMCSCTSTAAKTILGLADNAPQDCQITQDELVNSQAVKVALAPDVCSTKTCTAADAVSIGVKVQAVKAMF